MAGRTPREAVTAFIRPLQQSLSCISDNVLQFERVDSGHTGVVTSHDGEPVAVRLVDGGRLGLAIRHHYTVVEAAGQRGPWKVTSVGYLYAIEDAAGRELVAYHWHPVGSSTFAAPHLHLGAPLTGAVRAGNGHGLAAAHLPSGRVALESVILLMVAELGVRATRPDWQVVLARNLEKFERWRTWGGSTQPPRHHS